MDSPSHVLPILVSPKLPFRRILCCHSRFPISCFADIAVLPKPVSLLNSCFAYYISLIPVSPYPVSSISGFRKMTHVVYAIAILQNENLRNGNLQNGDRRSGPLKRNWTRRDLIWRNWTWLIRNRRSRNQRNGVR